MSKKPTDHQILKGFQKFEEGMNVALDVLREHHELVYPENLQAVEIARDNFFRAHTEYRIMAHAAQRRIDEKKKSEEGAER